MAAALEHQLVEARPAAIGALLTGTALLRVGASGAGVAVGFAVVDLFGGRPSGIDVGLVGASQAVSEMICAPVLARFADRWGRRLFLVGGPLLGVLGAILLAFAAHPRSLAVARLIEGIGAASFIPTALGTIAAATSRSSQRRANASGAFEAANLAGYAGGFVVGPFAYHALHHGAFLVLGGLYLTAALVCAMFVPRVPPLPVSPISRVIGAIVGPGPIRSFLPAWMAAFALLGAYAANLPALLHRSPVPGQSIVHAFDERLISAMLVTWIVLLLLGIALWVPVLPRLGPARTMRRAAPGAMLTAVGLLAINHSPLSLAPVFLPVAIAGILVVAGFGPAAVAYLAQCSETFVADRAALMSFYTVALAGGGAIGSLLGGLAVRVAYADGLVGLGLILGAVAFLALGPVVRYERALVKRVQPAAVPPAAV